MTSTPPNESNNPYQAYPNAGYGQGGYNQSGSPAGTAAPGGGRSDNYSNVGPAVTGPYSPNLSPHFSGTTAMLALLALVSLYEGTHRVILYSNSFLPWDASNDLFPAAALLVGGVWQAFYSLLTLFIAVWALLFDFHSIALTTLALGTQFVGWYTVIVFALGQPGYTADKWIDNQNAAVINGQDAESVAEFGIPSGALGSNESRAAYVFGWLFPLFAMNTALLAGLIFFTIQLMQIQTNDINELHSPTYYARRLSFWSFLELFYGLSTIIYAGIFLGEDINKYNQPEYFYPNLTSWGSLTLITGILMTCVGFFGLFTTWCCNFLMVSNLFIAMSWFTFLWVVGAHVMGQCGFVTSVSNQAGFGLAELGLFFGVLLIGMYLAYKAATIETVHRGNYITNQRGRVVV